MSWRAQTAEVARGIAPSILKAVVTTASLLGLFVVVLELDVFGMYLPVFLIAAVVIMGVAAGVILRRPAQLVATTSGVRFGTGTTVPWHEISAMYVDFDRKKVLDASHVADRESSARDQATTVSVPFFGYQSRRLLKSPKPTLYFSFGHWWTRYRLPVRIAFTNNTRSYLPSVRQTLGFAKLDVAIWLEGDPKQFPVVVAQLEGLRARTSAMPSAHAVRS